MVKDIKKALDILKDEDRDKQEAYRILERWGKPESAQRGEGND